MSARQKNSTQSRDSLVKFLREQKNIKLRRIQFPPAALFVLFDIFLLRCAYLKSHCSCAMEPPETAHEKIGTYMSADCFFDLHQFYFFFFDASNDRFSTVSRHEICRKITHTFISG